MSEATGDEQARDEVYAGILDALVRGPLHGGEAMAAASYCASATPADLVRAVDGAVARGVAFDDLKPAVSKLINLLSASLRRHRLRPPAGDRLFSSLMAENAALEALLDGGKSLAKDLNDEAPETRSGARDGLRALVAKLAPIDIHYQKKENVLFPWFEAHYPEYRCVRLMWEIQDDARHGLKELARLLDADADASALNTALGRLYFDLYANVFREECALFPVMAGLMDPESGEELFRQMRDYGYAFLGEAGARRFEGPEALEAAREYAASPKAAAEAREMVAAPRQAPPAAGFAGRTGSLPNEVLAAMFASLPVDMTWVDADDKVRWFSDSPHRIFPRSPAILGRDVRNCHPGASVGRVVAILEAMRRGERDSEAFWINLKGRFIHIEYFALRSPDGAYLGVLESSQDLTDKRALSGEKRLADGS